MNRLLAFLMVVGMAVVWTLAEAQEIILRLSPPELVVTKGSAPAFQLTVENHSPRDVKALDIAQRPALKWRYCELGVFSGAKNVILDMPSTIADVPYARRDERRRLMSGESFSFSHDGFPADLKYLTPGTYKVAAVCRRLVDGTDELSSNSVSLTVKE